MDDETRNRAICDEIVQAVREGRSPLVLTERNDHLDRFESDLSASIAHVVVLRRGMGKKQRRAEAERLVGMARFAMYGILPYTGRGVAMPTTNSTEERLEARISTEQKRLFKEAATLRGVTLTDFVVSSVHEAAVRTLEARHVIELSQKDQRALVDALTHPPAPNSALRRAWARHSASLGRSRAPRRLAKRAR